MIVKIALAMVLALPHQNSARECMLHRLERERPSRDCWTLALEVLLPEALTYSLWRCHPYETNWASIP